VLMALTPLLAGLLLARSACREHGWAARWQLVGTATGGVLLALFVLGWQAGGAIGAGELSTIGPSPWQFALAVVAAVVVVASAALGATAARSRLAGPVHRARPSERADAAGRLQLLADAVRLRTGQDVDADTYAHTDADTDAGADAGDAAGGSQRAG